MPAQAQDALESRRSANAELHASLVRWDRLDAACAAGDASAMATQAEAMRQHASFALAAARHAEAAHDAFRSGVLGTIERVFAAAEAKGEHWQDVLARLQEAAKGGWI